MPNNSNLTISAEGLRLLKKAEGSIPYVYDDGDGTWPKRRITSYTTKGYPTIGVGHLITKDQQERFRKYLGTGQNMPDDEILALLRYDVNRFEATLRPKIQVPITQSMWDALILQSFNTGANTHAIQTAIERINAKDWKGAQAALASGAKTSKGKVLQALVERRAEEAAMFLRDGMPGMVEKVYYAGQKRYQKQIMRHKKRQLLLGVGAAVFASITVFALFARSRM
jgi:GH24 family phage-related lysozyme (muramidase)